MPQTHTGAMKVRAAKLGLSLAIYLERCVKDKWCTGCKEWHPRGDFHPDRTRHDGLSSTCKSAKSKKQAGKINRSSSINQRRAHRMIQMRVKRGTIPNPNTLPCMDCGHTGSDRRHEYDHPIGYDTPEARATVEPTCSRCHADREVRRRKEHRNG